MEAGEFGAEHEIADRDLALGALVRTLDDGADRAALIGIFQLRVHAGGAEIEFGGDAGVAQFRDEALIARDLALIEDEHDHGPALRALR